MWRFPLLFITDEKRSYGLILGIDIWNKTKNNVSAGWRNGPVTLIDHHGQFLLDDVPPEVVTHSTTIFIASTFRPRMLSMWRTKMLTRRHLCLDGKIGAKALVNTKSHAPQPKTRAKN